MEAVNNLVRDYKYIVYCTTNKVNNKIYIGVHKTYSETFDGYLGCGVWKHKPYSYQRCNTIFQRAVTKYGPNNFIRKTIAVFSNEEDAMNLEQQLVDEQFLKRNDVYNMILGGYGNKSMPNPQKCYCYTLDGLLYKEFNSIRDAARAMTLSGVAFNSIKCAIIDKVSYHGFYWTIEKFKILDTKEYTTNRRFSHNIYQYNKNGDYECAYTTVEQAAKANNMCSSSLYKACILGYLSKEKYFSLEKNTRFSNAKLQYLKSCTIYVYDYSGKYLNEYPNEEAAKKALKIKGSLMKYLRLKEPYMKKYQFSFEKVDSMINRLHGEKLTTKRKLDQYDLNGNFIKTWNSIAECCKELHIHSNCISRILKGTQKKTKGFTFAYHKD